MVLLEIFSIDQECSQRVVNMIKVGGIGILNEDEILTIESIRKEIKSSVRVEKCTTKSYNFKNRPRNTSHQQ